jgi:DNA-binding response OmpR family regulator
MPGMDGYEVCQALKENELTSDIPVIFITAKDETFDKVEGLDIGGVDYITKPFHHAEVMARVRAHLRLKAIFPQTACQLDLRIHHPIFEHPLRSKKETRVQIKDSTQSRNWLEKSQAILQTSG